MCRCTWPRNPQRDYDGEETTEVQEENDAFDERELGGEHRVKGNREDEHRNRQEGPVIGVPGVVLHVQCDESLDDAATHESNAGEVGLPANGAKPAWKKSETLE